VISIPNQLCCKLSDKTVMLRASDFLRLRTKAVALDGNGRLSMEKAAKLSDNAVILPVAPL
jgi:hypothetical protein